MESDSVRASDGPPTAMLRVGGRPTRLHNVSGRRAACCTMRRMIVVGNERHGAAQGVTGSRVWSTP